MPLCEPCHAQHLAVVHQHSAVLIASPPDNRARLDWIELRCIMALVVDRVWAWNAKPIDRISDRMVDQILVAQWLRPECIHRRPAALWMRLLEQCNRERIPVVQRANRFRAEHIVQQSHRPRRSSNGCSLHAQHRLVNDRFDDEPICWN